MRPRPDDPERLRSARLVAIFGRIMARRMAAEFDGVRVVRGTVPRLPPDRPAIVYCNHPSWWDGAFLPVLVTRLFPDRRSFGPMDPAALERYPFMRRIGMFPVEPDSAAGAFAFLRTGRQLLDAADAMLWVTAEGRFTDPRRRPVRLQRGLARLLSGMDRGTVVPLALEYPFWDEPRPVALARFGLPLDVVPGRTAADWQGLLEPALEQTMDLLAMAAQTRNPAAFDTLVQGRQGMGGAYQLWQRARAWSQGRRFDPAHGAVRTQERAAVRRSAPR